MNYKNLPINFIKKLGKHFPIFKQLGENNKGIIHYKENMKKEEWAFEYHDKDEDYGFYFKISDFQYRDSDQAIFCKIAFRPTDPQRISQIETVSNIQDVHNHFNGWLALIEEYNSLELTSEDKIRNYYEDLYYADFEILDDDADDVPFDLERQLLIEQFAVLCLATLEREPEQNSELIQDAIEIRDTVQSSTKKEIIKKISKFFAKAAQKSLPLLKEFVVEARKTIWKKVAEFGMQQIQDLLHHGFKSLE